MSQRICKHILFFANAESKQKNKKSLQAIAQNTANLTGHSNEYKSQRQIFQQT